MTPNGFTDRDAPWPADTWSCSTPEELGVDSVRLIDMLKTVKNENIGIDGFLVIRNGRLIMEMYRYPYTADTLHHVYSCTKSFTSALIGIAIEQGRIKGPSQRVTDFFPDRPIANQDEAKRNITLGNLLTMSGGYTWLGGMLEQPTLQEWWQSPDWIQYVLDKPLSDPPGTRFVYNTGCSHLLSAVLQRSVGGNAETFAKSNLFTPLGIKDWYWQTDPQGISTGGWGLWLRPRDMAKLGYLYGNGGQWNDRQIVPDSWVAESIRKQIDAGSPWLSDGYGYQWWVDGLGYYMALGFGGQFIVAVPDRNLIMVTASCLSPKNFFIPETLLHDFILPASEAPAPLPQNPEAVAVLNDGIAALAGQERTSVPPLPPVAPRVSGKTYVRSEEVKTGSPGGRSWKTVSLSFTSGGESAFLIIDGGSIEIGLDGKYRANDPFSRGRNPPFARSAFDMGRGHWSDDGDFVIEHFVLGDAGRFVDTFHFEADALIWQQEAPTYGYSSKTMGRMKQ